MSKQKKECDEKYLIKLGEFWVEHYFNFLKRYKEFDETINKDKMILMLGRFLRVSSPDAKAKVIDISIKAGILEQISRGRSGVWFKVCC